jgi:hypothetical protein
MDMECRGSSGAGTNSKSWYLMILLFFREVSFNTSTSEKNIAQYTYLGFKLQARISSYIHTLHFQ